MNLENYQKFARAYQWTFIEMRGKSMPVYELDGLDKTKFYEASNLRTEEEIQRHETTRSARMEESIKHGITLAHVVEIDKTVKRLMPLTEPPAKKNIMQQLRMPFPVIFFDLDITPDELPHSAMFLAKGINKMIGLLVMKQRAGADGEIPGNDMYACALYSGDGKYYFEDCIFPLDGRRVIYNDNANVNVVRPLVYNLLMLMEHPEIEYRTFHRSEKNRQKRIRDKKLPLLDHTTIVLKGKMSRYLNEHRESIEGDGFDFRFWVRGHWRMHRAERYTTKRGVPIWIAPYLKGRGELRRSIYEVRPTKDEMERYKELFLFLDDVVPLDRPLHEIRQEQKAAKGGEEC